MQQDAHSIARLWSILLLLLVGYVAKGYAQSQPMPIVQEKVTYDEVTNRYLIHTIIGGQETEVPIVLTPAEYMEWSMQKSMREY